MSEMKKALVELSDRWVDESLANSTPPNECQPLKENKPFNQLIPGRVRSAMLKRFTNDQFGNQVN